MWPERGEALSRTIEAESAVSDLYAETLRRWAPGAREVVLPSLIAAALPPDPDALVQTQTMWDQHAEEIIVAGLGILWAVAVYETVTDLGGTIADIAVPDVSTVALGIVLASLMMNRDSVIEAVGHVEATPALVVARDEFLAIRRESVSATTSLVRKKVEAALAEPMLTLSVSPEDRPDVLRARAAEVLEPSSKEMRDLARNQGYQAADVLNHAVVAAATLSEDAAELQKTWICTIDGKTRPSHWAADGQRVPLKGHFTVGGEQLFIPGDMSASPAEWKNCRCRVGILAVDEALSDEVDRHTERLDGRDSVAVNRDGRTQAEEIERRDKAGNVRARDNEDGIGRVASGGWSAPSEQEYEMAEDTETYLTFTDQLFAVTGTPTSDGRMLAAGIELTFRDTPMPLQWCEEMEGGHYGSVTVGVIESIALKNGEVRASGYMLNNTNALKAIDVVGHGVNNPSVDLGSVTAFWTYEDGTVVTEENYDEDKPILDTTTAAEVLATTIVAIPAFGQTRLVLNAEREPRDKALVASAAARFQPRVYDPALFSDPGLSGPTPQSIDTATGRIFGHIADFKEKHRSVGLGHISPPRSRTGYAHFHSSPPVRLSDGTELPVGRLTVGIGHAPTTGVSNAEAQAHYDNAEACFALVRVGEDKHGIWFSGVAAPWATPEQIEMGLAAPLSGDWRPYGGNLELVAALAVNTPGFLCRTTTDSRGYPLAMVASMSPRPGAAGRNVYSREDMRADLKAAVSEALVESSQAVELAQRRTAVLARARVAVGDPPPEPSPAERMSQLLERV
ncbi:hypothetical protein [Mycobacterium sp. NPDC050853]|uniref:hypothetical protein n=1 Tax=Mycobacterium sp. NPDC050853 TaxID=3155160 RepID=UPI0033F60EF5